MDVVSLAVHTGCEEVVAQGDFMAGPKSKAFVAYASRNEVHAETLLEGVRRANALAQPYDYHPWQFNDVAGQPLISPILENIDDSALIIADITFLNLNVVYEIGYAIGKKKRAFLVRSSTLEGEKALARTTGIFDTLGYVEYADAHGLLTRLVAYIEERPIPSISSWIPRPRFTLSNRLPEAWTPP